MEALLPKGTSELTKQQIRYLLQVTSRNSNQSNAWPPSSRTDVLCVCFVCVSCVSCQTRLTADKSMRLLLSTFSSLREELMHMSEDLRV